MASNLGRWMKYAKAKLDDTLSSANKELDELEAEREAKVADKPWLSAEGDAPTLDEVRARIEAQSQQARPDGPGRAGGAPTTQEAGRDEGPTAGSDPATPTEPTTAGRSTSSEDDLRSGAEAAELSQAKLELEARERQTAERLAQIRRELGVDSPPGPKA